MTPLFIQRLFDKNKKNGNIDWQYITLEMFQEFQSTTLPFILRGGSTKHGGYKDENNVTNKQLENFEHSIKINTE